MHLPFIGRVCLVILCFIWGINSAVIAQNAIVVENSKPGNPSSEWDIVGAGDQSIQGFATNISVNKGDTVRFKVNITGTNKNFSIRIYRIGYYQGNGARLITSLGPIAGVTQPSPITNTSFGLIDCGNWSQSATWAVPSTAVSGVYIARLIRADNGGASHIVFIVRDDQATADMLFKTSDATWQAYNVYGGSSLYTGSTTFPAGHAVKVSYNRPFITRAGGGGGGASEDWLFNAEYPMIRWLERNGYNIVYATDVDFERMSAPITPDKYKALLSVGHDEYWSANERNRFEEARAAGVHLAFFSGNEVYWKARWENSIDGTGTPYRTLVCYKEGTLGENVCNTECDPSSNWTGLWRSGCGATATDACKPENALTGQISWDEYTGSILVPALYKNHRFWRNTSIPSLTTGQVATLPFGTLGYETDIEQATYASSYPSGRITLSSTSYNGKVHKLSLYKHSSGALVFGAGTVQWSWGLDDKHDRGSEPPSAIMQQATVNLFADMGVQPASLQSGLVPSASSSDIEPPVSIITTPTHGSNLTAGTPVTISGTSTDGNVVAGVEVSVDGGQTWQLANGTTDWNFTWVPVAAGSITIKVRGFDDSGNMEEPGAAPSGDAITVTVEQQQCPCTIWSPTVVPGTVAEPDNQSVEVGVKFRSYVDGYIKGIRFYKSSTNTGTHIGNLWTITGTNLARATFSNESATGWQEVIFSKPVAITAGTTYVASYFTPTGYYSADENYFATKGVVTSVLVALQNGVDGPNGVYSYGSNTVFPTNTFNASNYYVDVVFANSLAKDTIAPKIVSTNPANTTQNAEVTTVVNITFNEAINPLSVSGTTIELRTDSDNVLVPATVSYMSGSKTAMVTPSAALAYATRYKVFVKGGLAGIKDTAGNSMEKDSIFRFTTKVKPPLPSDGPGGPILVLGSSSNAFSLYTAEILRAEGFNNFTSGEIASLSSAMLSNYDVVVLGEVSLTANNITDLTNWVNAGGTLVAFRPVTGLYPLLGISAAAGSLAEGYVKVNNSTDEGKGLVQATMQFHGTANYVTLNGATSLATLYSSATVPTAYPAVIKRVVGTSGGVAYAFLYDLPRSIVYTRQGNPAWAGQKRDGTTGPIRSDDLFYPNWVDFSKISIPQADEQQHFLANMIHVGTIDRKPLPRFWFLPKGLKAAVVMTGDDHASNGTSTVSRFDRYRAQSSSNTPEAIANWDAVRATSYIYPLTLITNDEVIQAQHDGFEVGLHLNTGCTNFTPTSWTNDWNAQYTQIKSLLPGMLDQNTHRTHCIAWSDYATQAKKQAALGVRLDVNYYYWPGPWILNRPGVFTGSGMPMRFADVDGSLIDCYQVVTQLTDESDQDLALHIKSLLDSALGAPGYYGVFCANMHTDNVPVQSLAGSDLIVEQAQARNVPVVSSRQMLEWIDGRNGSTFKNMLWRGDTLSFSIYAAPGSRNMKAMLPLYTDTKMLSAIYYAGSVLNSTAEIIKGVPYVFFDATLGEGAYQAIYTTPQAPVISNVKAVVTGINTATITWNTNIYSDSKVSYGVTKSNLSAVEADNSLTQSHKIEVKNLLPGTVYYYRVSSREYLNNSMTIPAMTSDPLPFITPALPCAIDTSYAQFLSGTVDSNSVVTQMAAGGVILKPAVLDEFSGTTLNTTNWTNASYVTGGTTVLSGGQVTVNGTHIYSKSAYGPGTKIEFEATFRNSVNQTIGFSANKNYNTTPWVVIGLGATADSNLYIRTSDNKVYNLGTAFIGSAHRYAIQWNTPANTFSFYADGKLIASSNITLAVSGNMYLQVSDRDTTGGKLSVNWFRILPYKPSGTYTSRVMDYGATATWTNMKWGASTPGSSYITFQARAGNTAIPDLTWSAYKNISIGDTVNLGSRYIQYRATLNTINTAFTPELYQVSIGCKDVNSIISITQQPVSVEQCDGTTATFISKASSGKPMIVQWQYSADGVSWADMLGENKDTLRTILTQQANGRKYRAAWINGFETKYSSVATSVIRSVTIGVSAKTDITCFGAQNGSVSLTASGGTQPYQYRMNAGLYQSGSVFSNLANGTFAFSVRDTYGCMDDTSIIIVEPAQLLPALVTKTDVFCKGASTGTFTLSATGGTGPYQFNVNNGGYQSIAIFTSLPAGSYMAGVKDAKGCTASLLVVITEPAKLAAAQLTKVDLSCNANQSGSISVTGTGGVLPYQYRLNGGAFQSMNTFGNLASGNYAITIKDANGCTFDTSVVLSEPPVLLAGVSAKLNVSCYAGSNGLITIAATGGTAPYQYSLNGGAYQSNSTFSSLPASTYSLGVKDAKGCMASSTALITEPTKLVIDTATVQQVSCFGGANGSILLTVSGGTLPYRYKKDSGAFQALNIFSGLSKGTYQITVNDSAGCAVNRISVVNEPEQLIATITAVTAATCYGTSTGSLSVTGSGGQAPYAYSINNGPFQSATLFPSLAAGTYTVTVRDVNGCTQSSTATVNQPAKLIATEVTKVNIDCYGGQTGTITITGSGGLLPYQYRLNGGAYQLSNSFGNLASGQYTVSLQDANGCVLDSGITLSQPSVLFVGLVSKSEVTCKGGTNGSISVSATGGTTPYQYSLNNGLFLLGSTFSGLTAGSYDVRVRDAKGCISTVGASITEPDKLVFDAAVVNNISCSGLQNGSIFIAAAGGKAPYQYSLNGASFKSNNSFSNLAKGLYSITIRDANGCAIDTAVTISEPTSLSVTVVSKMDIACAGTLSGSVMVSGVGGTMPYTYSMNGGSYQAAAQFNGLAAGNYLLTVRDTGGCTAAVSVVLTQPEQLAVSVTDIINNPCAGLQQASFRALPRGGVTPYLFSIDNRQTFTDSTRFVNLPARTYQLLVKDANGCVDSLLVSITEPAPLTAAISKQFLACQEDTTGSFSVIASGGVGPWQLLSSNVGNTFVNSMALSGLAAGEYVVSIIDANNCTKDTVIKIEVEKAIWQGSVSSDWHEPANWSTQKVPSTTTHVIVPNGTPNPCTISTADVNISSLQIKDNAPLIILHDRQIMINGVCRMLPSN